MPNKMFRDPFIGEVRAGLARNGYTQNDLARALHLSRAAVARRLRGDVAFNYREIKIIARFLGTSVAELFGERAA